MAPINSIKKLIQKILRIFGLRLSKINGRNFDEIILDIFNIMHDKNSEMVFFDVGAHRGESIERFIRLAKNNSHLIFSFEAASIDVASATSIDL
jgi:hypothetical protein